MKLSKLSLMQIRRLVCLKRVYVQAAQRILCSNWRWSKCRQHDEGCRCCRQLKIKYNSSQYPNQAGQLYSRLRVYQWNEKKRNNVSMQTDLSKQSFSLGIVFVIFSMANPQNAQFLTRRQYTRISNLAGHPKSCVSNQTGKISVLPVTWLLRL